MTGKAQVEPMINKAWEDFKSAMIREDADPDFIEGHKTTFYAGAWVTHSAMVAAANNVTLPAFVNLLLQLGEEMVTLRIKNTVAEAERSIKN